MDHGFFQLDIDNYSAQSLTPDTMWNGCYLPTPDTPTSGSQLDPSLLPPSHLPTSQDASASANHCLPSEHGDMRDWTSNMHPDHLLQRLRGVPWAPLKFWLELRKVCEDRIVRARTGCSPQETGPVPPDLADESNSTTCRWDNCTVNLNSTEVPVIKKHLLQYHFGDRADWIVGERGYCFWKDCDYRKSMKCSSFAKHIATTHLKTTSRFCQNCGKLFTRGDSESRHRKNGTCQAHSRGFSQ
ncbi:hypothetical protein SCP_1103460 [Sparassis crispa]|uniref:C2H2-type domain-containing protein n=1 Tax=Sparassis crispa TaxID=139825 RepID=A0A401GZV6_9APHY|nr:hypothetical protein SCP_1103460 [Sparassis crispa]GBE87669.1 hypothetical protein SCP_1103460 [Sparassis crispa]